MIKTSNLRSVYIHIPFCNTICSYCDFCKIYYNKKMVDDYLNSLEEEIRSSYKNETIETIYIGGGTPSSLNISQLKKLFKIIKIFKTDNLEFTIECNIENITEEKVKLFRRFGVNRISVGIQTFNEKYIKFLNRNHKKVEVFEKIFMIKRYIENINVDLIYAIPSQTLEELKNDLEEFLKLDVKHISTYSLIIEKHTKLYNNKTKNIDEELDFKMYQEICNILNKNNFNHYEISNFAKEGYESRHNLTYWNNEFYYGFGLGASGYIANQRYTNTFNMTKYLKEIYLKEHNNLSFNETVENEFILGFRKLKGINLQDFYYKYEFNPLNIEFIKGLIEKKELLYLEPYLRVNPEKIYIENEILCQFLDYNYQEYVNCKKDKDMV